MTTRSSYRHWYVHVDFSASPIVKRHRPCTCHCQSQFRGIGQVFISVFCDIHVIFDPHPPHIPVLGQHVLVDVWRQAFILEDGVDDEFAKVDLRWMRC